MTWFITGVLSHDAGLFYFAYQLVLLSHNAALLTAAVVYFHRVSANVATQQLFGHRRALSGAFSVTSADFERDPVHEVHVLMLPKLSVPIFSSEAINNYFLVLLPLESIIPVGNEK